MGDERYLLSPISQYIQFSLRNKYRSLSNNLPTDEIIEM